ncbi:MAG TPA: hypothetical protein VMS17_30325 [Gemmataceae bacterium]|nr:hypothetical protein [Gemmataceae bacterium]
MSDIRPASELGREDYPPMHGRLDTATSPSSGVEWGVAALVLGVVFAVMMPPALLLALLIGHEGVGASDKSTAEAAGYFFIALILMLSAAGVAFGVLSINGAQRARRPIALGLAAVMLNALNLLMWAGGLLAWHSAW